MNETEELLSKFQSGKFNREDCEKFLLFDEDQCMPFFNLAKDLKLKYIGNSLKIYIPDKRFPAISLTGNKCALHCEHCNEKYLKGMKPILDTQNLRNYLMELSKSGGVGALLSGGCKEDGSVPLGNYLDTVKEIKRETDLIINTHTGLLNEETAQKLAQARVDIVSFDVNMDDKIIREIYHLEKDVGDYEKAIDLMLKYNLNIVPHICIGLYYGNLNKELYSLKIIKKRIVNPSLIVLIALIPPKNKKNKFKAPRPIDIAKIIALTRFMFPKTEISLGCMRPRKNIRLEIEKRAIQAGIDRMEIPSIKTIKWLKQNNPDIQLKYFSACCAIPNNYEQVAISHDSDIKRYLAI